MWPFHIANDDGVAEVVALLDNFPRTMHGAALLCLDDNINTDGIYPGKYTYREDIDAAMQAKVVMENYDERFASLVQPGASAKGRKRVGCGSLSSSLNGLGNPPCLPSEERLELSFNFLTLAFAGNILVAGFNFGTGSSREQAATALKHGKESTANAAPKTDSAYHHLSPPISSFLISPQPAFR
jgi:homoaconitate hydratase